MMDKTTNKQLEDAVDACLGWMQNIFLNYDLSEYTRLAGIEKANYLHKTVYGKPLYKESEIPHLTNIEEE